MLHGLQMELRFLTWKDENETLVVEVANFIRGFCNVFFFFAFQHFAEEEEQAMMPAHI